VDAHELLVSPLAYMPPARILDGLSQEQAAVRPPGASHSVLDIVAHVIFWQGWFLERCTGVATPPPARAALGWPAVTVEQWPSLRQRFLQDLERAAELASDKLAAARRVEPSIEFEPLANYTIADAVTHAAIHNAHHLGQIVTLRQIIGAWPPPDGSYTW
jgi:uncharacterized damage-inducible protein DinB